MLSDDRRFLLQDAGHGIIDPAGLTKADNLANVIDEHRSPWVPLAG